MSTAAAAAAAADGDDDDDDDTGCCGTNVSLSSSVSALSCNAEGSKYTMDFKKMPPNFSSISSPNKSDYNQTAGVFRTSDTFEMQQTLWKICNNAVTEYPTTPLTALLQYLVKYKRKKN